jgi:predicted Zn-dependent peptidase
VRYELFDRPNITVLPGGLHLLTIARPNSPTVALRFFVRAGSRFDVEAQSSPAPLGLAHLTEHTLFHDSGMQRRLAQIERLGGLLEAETSKEYCRFTVVTLDSEVADGMSVLAELIQAPVLSDSDLLHEKITVLQELARRTDSYSIIFDHFAKLMWPAHPLGHPILGTEEGLQEITQEIIGNFFKKRFVTGNAVLVACGAIDPGEIEHLAEQNFSILPFGLAQPPMTVYQPPNKTPLYEHIEKNTHQTHLLIGVPTVGMKHPDRSALKVIERVLGMGASGRLYRRLRGRDRLVYSVRAITAQYEDLGYFAVYTASALEAMDKVQDAILEEWDTICQEGITPAELRVAQSNYAGTLARNFETNLAVAGIIGVEFLLHRLETMAEAIQRINAVQCEDVRRLARKYLDANRAISISMGPKVKTNER